MIPPRLRSAVLAVLATQACQSHGTTVVTERSASAAAPRATLPAATAGGPENPTGAGIAVLELFTSEGCSSCPAADEALAELTREAAANHARVVTLELHVDYWNYLGWADPFSDAVHSQRQDAYARRFRTSGMYTPQVVVNGKEELVGSNRPGLRAAVARALQAPPRAQVSLRATRGTTDVELSYHVTAPGPVDVSLAVAVDATETRVTRGENANQLLRHRHVVRAFKTVRLAPGSSGKWATPWPHQGGVFVAAYATDPASLEVLGADAHSLAARAAE